MILSSRLLSFEVLLPWRRPDESRVTILILLRSALITQGSVPWLWPCPLKKLRICRWEMHSVVLKGEDRILRVNFSPRASCTAPFFLASVMDCWDCGG